MSNTSRDKAIDVLRGIAIISVVIGHALNGGNFDEKFLFRFIYSYHMPLFFFISGYLMAYRTEYNLKWAGNRFLRLGIPFFVWAILGCLVRSPYLDFASIPGTLRQVIIAPDAGGLWFIWVLLMLSYVIAIQETLIQKLCKKDLSLISYLFVVVLVFVCLGLIWAMTGFGTILGIRLVFKNILFIEFGLLTNRFGFDHKLTTRGWAISSLAFFIMVPFWHRVQFTTFAASLHDMIYPYSYLIILPFYFLTTVFGIIFWWGLAHLMSQRWNLRFLTLMGCYSMEVYILDQYFSFCFTSFDVLNLMLQILLPVLIAYLLEKNKYIGAVLFGRYR